MPDRNFVLEFDDKSRVVFGAYHAGTFRFVDKETVQFELHWTSGPSLGQSVPPILFKMQFFNNGQIMALINGANTIALEHQ